MPKDLYRLYILFVYTSEVYLMKDIFDAKISCKNCNVEMKPMVVEKKGFKLRAVQCRKCGEKIIHPYDFGKMKQYDDMKRKTYNVKLRVVGNSHAISIPKEIVDFINDTQRQMSRHMNDMVKLCFEDFGKLSLKFFDEGDIKWRRIKE
jgi:DNA-directed RNA polymerase subunit M/transcription elongation factor TFIIS